MARTQGHGNPKWTREETILALELYFECEERPPSGSDARVLQLSRLLRQLPYHSEASKRESFRNGDGVAFKLQNLRQIATGRGLGNVAKTDREVWGEFGTNPERLKSIASLIKKNIEIAGMATHQESDQDDFTEGRIATIVHLKRERHPLLRKRMIASRRKSGALSCDICKTENPIKKPSLEDAIFEVHHIIPLALGEEDRKTRLSDLALLCANCHRMLHRLIAIERRWVGIDEAKLLCMGRTVK